MIGEEFMNAVAYADFKVEGNVFPFIRAACLAAQLTSPKSQDGIAKLLTKTDMEKLKSKGMQKQLVLAEQGMALAWDVLEKAGLPLQASHGIFGKLLTRTILHLCDKHKLGREPKGFPSFEAINEKFAMEVRAKQAGELPAVPEGPASSAEVMPLLLDASNPAKVGNNQKMKTKGGE